MNNKEKRNIGLLLVVLALFILSGTQAETQSIENPFKDPGAFFQGLEGTALNIVLGILGVGSFLLITGLFFK